MKNLVLIAFLFASSAAFGQDIFQKNLYSFDRIMENREKLELSDAQATKIKKIHAENAGDFSTLKWDLDAATSRLKKMLEVPKIDPASVSKQMDEVLRLESLLKKKQLNTLVAIKNELSIDQQKLLDSRSPVTIHGYGTYREATNSSPKASSVRMGYRASTPTNASSMGTGYKASTSAPRVIIHSENKNSDEMPLYIIKTKDGELERTDLNGIDPNGIESISVLKDKAATELYGEKGKNGVIIITLKKNNK